MRAIVVAVAALALIAPGIVQGASAQDRPPMVGDQPLKQIQPRGGKAAAAKPEPAAARMLACLEIEDESKERLDCFDAIVPPKPAAGKRKLPPARTVTDCRLIREQDERLACFNGFANKLPKPAAG